jgi:hypothetical protein
MSLLLLHTDWGHSSTLHPVTCPKAHGFWALEREAWVACLQFWREQSAVPRPLALTCGMHVGMRHLVILLTTSALSRTASRRHPTDLKSLSRYPIQLRGVGREELGSGSAATRLGQRESGTPAYYRVVQGHPCIHLPHPTPALHLQLTRHEQPGRLQESRCRVHVSVQRHGGETPALTGRYDAEPIQLCGEGATPATHRVEGAG